MLSPLLSILSVMLVGQTSAMSLCTMDELQRMHKEYVQCRDNFTTTFHQSKSVRGDGACEMVEKIINICSSRWEQCHTSQDMKKLKEIHLSSLIRQWEGELRRENCQTESLIRENRAMDCSQEQSDADMNSAQSCVDTISRTLYGEAYLATDPQHLSNLYCASLANISTECATQLKNCYTTSEIEQLTFSAKNEWYIILREVVSDDVPFKIPNCKEKEIDGVINSSTSKISKNKDEEAFRNSKTAGEVFGCNQQESTASVTSFQNCTYAIISSSYNQMTGSIQTKALDRISEECPVHLMKCFPMLDFEQITSTMEEQIKELLITLVNQKVTPSDLSLCGTNRSIDVGSSTTKPLPEPTNKDGNM